MGNDGRHDFVAAGPDGSQPEGKSIRDDPNSPDFDHRDLVSRSEQAILLASPFRVRWLSVARAYLPIRPHLPVARPG
jgi:hypothetical protein